MSAAREEADLSDRSQLNSVTLQVLYDFFGLNTSRASARAGEIEKACKIRMGHEGLCSGRLLDTFNLVQLANGLVITKSWRKKWTSSKIVGYVSGRAI
jgi:hypothetical protein